MLFRSPDRRHRAGAGHPLIEQRFDVPVVQRGVQVWRHFARPLPMGGEDLVLCVEEDGEQPPILLLVAVDAQEGAVWVCDRLQRDEQLFAAAVDGDAQILLFALQRVGERGGCAEELVERILEAQLLQETGG